MLRIPDGIVKDPLKGGLLLTPSAQIPPLESFMAAAAGALVLPAFQIFAVSVTDTMTDPLSARCK
ncbi:hypothetical protein [Streptomyces spongiae]|uniref:Uncharacterized protein n=1 Tax=Streptomyces spongiae TaxID=565072 RepID=A0A5N8XHI8_9ACTN|nr:hypothetical protein [Streptomyces spongiae]MPY58438.1 hypothetical protein [Streptomyces spongiae]